MKKTYIAPALVCGGEVVSQTRVGTDDGIELPNPMKKPALAGSVGYYL